MVNYIHKQKLFNLKKSHVKAWLFFIAQKWAESEEIIIAKKEKEEKYLIGIISSTKTEQTIRFVTHCAKPFALWEAGKKALTFSKADAVYLANGLCMNGTLAVPILANDYLSLENPDEVEK